MIINYDVTVLEYAADDTCFGEVDHSQYFRSFTDALAWGISKLIDTKNRSFGIHATGIHANTVWFENKELGHWSRSNGKDIIRLR